MMPADNTVVRLVMEKFHHKVSIVHMLDIVSVLISTVLWVV